MTKKPSIFKRIIDATKNNKTDPILIFDQLTIIKQIGEASEQGIVVIVENKIKKQFALKFLRSPSTGQDAKIMIKQFINEVTLLKDLHHKNIVRVYDGGEATWIDSEKDPCWNVDHGFKNKNSVDECHVFYYVMDLIRGDSMKTIFPPLGEDKKIDWKPNRTDLEQFEQLITQISEGMKYYHSKKIWHKDIKPANILFSAADSTFVIVDFGFARKAKKQHSKYKQLHLKEIIDPAVINSAGKVDYSKTDMYQIASILKLLLPYFDNHYDENRLNGIQKVLDQCLLDEQKSRPENMEEFYESITPYLITTPKCKFELKLEESLTQDGFSKFDSKIRLPLSGSILVSKEIREIIDSPEFQRLRGVRQLGPTNFVYPGANHTRFEHSLGVYWLALRYLDKLLDFPTFRKICKPVDESIKLVVLAALLHDIGHYPYSHWVEEISTLSKRVKVISHEDRAKKMILSGGLRKKIEETWKVNVDDVIKLISNKKISDSRFRVLNSIINSIIDVDRLDYLMRDSIHCGVEYGKGIDLERFVDSVYISDEVSNGEEIIVTDKGRSVLLAIVSTRNVMYRDVYWHKTVRACDSMFKRFFYEFAKDKSKDQIEKLFSLSDDVFISTLYNSTKKSPKLNNLIQSFAMSEKDRSIYRPAYIHYYGEEPQEQNDTCRFFNRLAKAQYDEIVKLNDKLAKELQKENPELDKLDIILEKTPLKDDDDVSETSARFKIWNIRKKRGDSLPDLIKKQMSYLSENTQAYIFCNPKYYQKLEKLFSDRKKLNQILGKVVN